MNYYIFYFYCIGIVIAFICGCIEAYIEEKKGYDISDFPGAVVTMAFCSWFYVYYFLKKYV